MGLGLSHQNRDGYASHMQTQHSSLWSNGEYKYSSSFPAANPVVLYSCTCPVNLLLQPVYSQEPKINLVPTKFEVLTDSLNVSGVKLAHALALPL